MTCGKHAENFEGFRHCEDTTRSHMFCWVQSHGLRSADANSKASPCTCLSQSPKPSASGPTDSSVACAHTRNDLHLHSGKATLQLRRLGDLSVVLLLQTYVVLNSRFDFIELMTCIL